MNDGDALQRVEAVASPDIELPRTDEEISDGGGQELKPSGRILAALMMVIILGSLDQNIVNTALPRMAAELGGLPHLSWVVMAFLLTITISTPIYGKLGDMYGRPRLLLASIGIFLVASSLCGFAANMTQLILFRGLQGLGAGGLLTLAQAAIGDVAGPRGRGRYQGLFAAALAVGTVAGPLVGGLITTALSWRWVFLVNIPVGIVAVLFLLRSRIPISPAKPHRIDFPGAFLLVGATVPGLLVLSWGGTIIPWRSGLALGLILASATFCCAFFLQERRADEPLIEPAMFRIQNFVIAVSASACMTFAMNATMVFMPLYCQFVLGLDPTRAGLMMVPQITTMILTSVVGGRISSRTGLIKPFMMLGVGCEALGLVLCAVFAWLGAPIPAFLLALAVLGFGMGMGMPNTIVVIQNAVPRERLGVATSTMSFMRSLSGLLGVAVSGSVMTSRLAAYSIRAGSVGQFGPGSGRAISTASYQHAIASSFTVGGVVMICAFFLVVSLGSVRFGEERR